MTQKVTTQNRISPEELARRHPVLYHISAPDAWPSIQKHGLLATTKIIQLYELNAQQSRDIIGKPRKEPIAIHHAQHGTITINDNKPLSEKALSACLDDNLTPQDWLYMLNQRVFFWSNKRGMQRLLEAKINRGRPRLVLEVDCLALAKEYYSHIEISPINSGSTVRKAARRGLSTFTPISTTSYKQWQMQRGKRDTILEVTLPDAIPDINRFVLKHYLSS